MPQQCLETSRDVFIQEVNLSKAGHLPYVFTLPTNVILLQCLTSNYLRYLKLFDNNFLFWVFQSKRAMLWNSLVPKDKILQGNTCLKMIYKSLEY